MTVNYKDAGVDVCAGYEAVKLMKTHVAKTFNQNVLSNLGSFGGLYALDITQSKQPVLVAGTDGVGTKLKIAFLMDKHDTIGQDCVAMCVNDIICQGASPLFFLDYIATGKLIPTKIEQIVKGVADGCLIAGCALIGGETAEMPGFYPDDEYDLAGFSVGMVDQSKIINGSSIKKGDVLIGIASSGIHSNGYSLIRKLILQDKTSLDEYSNELGCTIGEELLRPTQIYVKSIMNLLKTVHIKGIAHITGGGFIENIPRIMPDGLSARIILKSWSIPPIFSLLQQLCSLNQREMYNTFNMGIGMVVAVSPLCADMVLEELNQNIQCAFLIGEVYRGKEGVDLCQR